MTGANLMSQLCVTEADAPPPDPVAGVGGGSGWQITQIADPVARLRATAEANSVAKEHSSAIGASLLQDRSQFAAPAVYGIAMRPYASTG